MSVMMELIDDVRFIFRFRMKKGRVMKELDRAAPKAGDPAPDFTLLDASGANPMRLSDFRGRKPVALIFGSYT